MSRYPYMPSLMQSRRDWLTKSACGFGSLALAAVHNHSLAADHARVDLPAIVPKAKRVIFLFMQGGPSHVDSFDYKPLLAEQHGKTIDFADDRVEAKTGARKSPHRVMQSPWQFQRYGETGRYVSSLFSETARHIDSLCMIHSMHTEGVAHGPATLFLHCGSTNTIRPSMGSWIYYGLGTENENLPGFVSLCPSAGNGGPRNYGNAFLPALYQGTPIGTANGANLTLQNMTHPSHDVDTQRRSLDLTQRLNALQMVNHPGERDLDSVIQSYELAWRMQQSAPNTLDLAQETQATLDLYGVGQKETDRFGRQCLMARRMCESGVRYVQVNYGDDSANPAWDQHSDLPQHEKHAKRVDRPIAGLLQDLRQRGLLEDTIVWWGAEFGRTPYAQENGTGRDHNPSGFTMWLTGGGIQPGMTFGSTDPFGHQAVENKVHMHDLHATILYLLGIDHQRLTFRYAGRDFRLTDVHGRVIHDIIQS
jgi:hypothetical protein